MRAAHPGRPLVFVDGWTGKGSIAQTLARSLPADVPVRLAVLSDPAGVADFAATHDDLLLPHAALNATCQRAAEPHLYRWRGGPARGEGRGAAARRRRERRVSGRAGRPGRPLGRLTFRLTPGPRPARPYDAVLALAAELGVATRIWSNPGWARPPGSFCAVNPPDLLLRDPGHPDTLHLRALAGRAHSGDRAGGAAVPGGCPDLAGH